MRFSEFILKTNIPKWNEYDVFLEIQIYLVIYIRRELRTDGTRTMVL